MKKFLGGILIVFSFICAMIPCFSMVVISLFESLAGNHERPVIIQFVIGSLSTIGVLVLTTRAFRKE